MRELIQKMWKKAETLFSCKLDSKEQELRHWIVNSYIPLIASLGSGSSVKLFSETKFQTNGRIVVGYEISVEHRLTHVEDESLALARMYSDYDRTICGDHRTPMLNRIFVGKYEARYFVIEKERPGVVIVTVIGSGAEIELPLVDLSRFENLREAEDWMKENPGVYNWNKFTEKL